MTDPTPQGLIDHLSGLLEQERRSILRGELEFIADIASKKEALIDALNALEPNPQFDLVSLQRNVVRNQALLDGTLQGIRKVATRLAALRKIRRSLETYDASGSKQTIQGDCERSVERRA